MGVCLLITQKSCHSIAPMYLLMQEFPADQPGRYVNKVDFGALRAYLGAKYFYESDQKIRVKFVRPDDGSLDLHMRSDCASSALTMVVCFPVIH